MLTVTANGIDTSPVVRGVWLLENILGTPPSPPPPDVPPLDPDIRGAKDDPRAARKASQRGNAATSATQDRPAGLCAGEFRRRSATGADRYDGKTPIDSAGELPSGQKFDDIEGFKAILVERQEQFVTGLWTTSCWLMPPAAAWSTPIGRTSSSIVQRTKQPRADFRDLMQLVAASDVFRSK